MSTFYKLFEVGNNKETWMSNIRLKWIGFEKKQNKKKEHYFPSILLTTQTCALYTQE